jgi:hypothetical protein
MSTVGIVLLVLLYLVIAFVAYKRWISKWDNKEWEKVLFSLFWIGVLPLWAIYKLHFFW